MDIRSLLCVTASSIAESFSRGPLRFRTFSRMFSYPKIEVESMVSTKWQQYWFGKPIYEPSNTLSWVCKCNSGSKKKDRTEVVKEHQTLALLICCLWRPISLSIDLICPSNSGLSSCNVSASSASQIPSRLTLMLMVHALENGSGHCPSPGMNKGKVELR